ncbi:MAG: hypothetical protein NMNS01_21080 [Nitrosomonas sp.]|nr:MAG: hypothetical protein NMNS01_21080 [Nitrosomonas sp.]
MDQTKNPQKDWQDVGQQLKRCATSTYNEPLFLFSFPNRSRAETVTPYWHEAGYQYRVAHALIRKRVSSFV